MVMPYRQIGFHDHHANNIGGLSAAISSGVASGIATVSGALPPGGAQGQVLAKSSASDWDIDWHDIEYMATAETDDTLRLAPDGSGGVQWVAGGGAAGGSIWVPDAPPASAGSQDDEFADASGGVPSGWTEVDHGARITVTEDEAGLKLTETTGSGAIGGIYKSIPAGDFTIWTKVALSGIGVTNFVVGGLTLYEDAASIAGDLRTFHFVSDAASTGVTVQSWTAYNAFSATLVGHAISVDTMPTHIYLRIRRTGSTYSFDASSDGIGWVRIYSTGALGITPTHFGPSINNDGSGADVVARFAFFRYLASDVGIGGLMAGDRVNIFRT